MKFLSWYCVIISTYLLISYIFVPTQAFNLPWHVAPIMMFTIVIYALFFLLAALNRNIPVVLAYSARIVNVFYGLIALLGAILFVHNSDLWDIAIVAAILPLLFFCEIKVRTILKLNRLSTSKEKFTSIINRKDWPFSAFFKKYWWIELVVIIKVISKVDDLGANILVIIGIQLLLWGLYRIGLK
jgi:hypothetical protein